MIFELVVVDTKAKAEKATPIITDTYRQQYVFVGEDLSGVHYNGIRPNKLTIESISLYCEREVDWYNEVLYPAVRIPK